MMALYCDGGVIRRNPSPIGGTWAWCLVENNEIKQSASGYIMKAGITNNQTEIIAIILALEAMPDGWSGLICSDSSCSLSRIFNAKKQPKKCPGNVWMRLLYAVTRAGKLEGKLIKGHPTEAELKAGIARGGLPVSRFNVWCDEQCQMQSRKARGL